jgi:hypothetical protein
MIRKKSFDDISGGEAIPYNKNNLKTENISKNKQIFQISS